MNFRRTLMALLATALGATFALSASSADQVKAAPERHKVVFQMSDGDPKKWHLALNNARNVQEDLGARNVDIEIVAYGPGIGMIKLDSEAANRVGEAIAAGVKVVACENTMTNMKLKKADMLPSLGYVPAGVVELMQRQKEGYAYIRP